MCKGAKFRLKPSVSKSQIISLIENSLLKLKKKLSKKCKVDESCFDMWFDLLMAKVKFRVKSLNSAQLKSNDIFEQEYIIDYLQGIHDRFVIVPVTKQVPTLP
jgi:hypothetical protein